MTLEGPRKVIPLIGPATHFLPPIETGLGKTQWILWQPSTVIFIYSLLHWIKTCKYHIRQLCITSTKYLAYIVQCKGKKRIIRIPGFRDFNIKGHLDTLVWAKDQTEYHGGVWRRRLLTSCH